MARSIFAFHLLYLVTQVLSDGVSDPGSNTDRRGVLVHTEGLTNGVAAYFTTDGGPSALSICANSSSGDQTCGAFTESISKALQVGLLDITRNEANAAGIGDPDQPAYVNSRRWSDTQADMATLLSAIGEHNTGATIETIPAIRAKRHERARDLRVSSAGKGDFKYDLVIGSTSKTKGSVGVAAAGSLRARNIEAETPTKINPDASLQTAQSVDGPGFKVIYKGYPEDLSPSTLDSASLTTVQNLADAVAQDWAKRASITTDGSRYLGVFEQNRRMVMAFEVIPERQGFGIGQEDPNEFCGPLDSFACLDDRSCYALTDRTRPPGQLQYCQALKRDDNGDTPSTQSMQQTDYSTAALSSSPSQDGSTTDLVASSTQSRASVYSSTAPTIQGETSAYSSSPSATAGPSSNAMSSSSVSSTSKSQDSSITTSQAVSAPYSSGEAESTCACTP